MQEKESLSKKKIISEEERARKVEEATSLVETGFEYVCIHENTM